MKTIARNRKECEVIPMIIVGALVKKVHPNDGSCRSGKPYGKPLVVLEQKENPYWISCMNGIGKYFILSDGDWAIEQNLRQCEQWGVGGDLPGR